ncbi:MAG: hypothetical protein JHC93_07895 [Parachlamydiales bacterium]|nr:hypothetical protein [Parachlamydiales bacterium]
MSNALNLSKTVYTTDEITIANLISKKMSEKNFTIQSYGSRRFVVLESQNLATSNLKRFLYKPEHLYVEYNVKDTFPEVEDQRDPQGNLVIQLRHFKQNLGFELSTCSPKVNHAAKQILEATL